MTIELTPATEVVAVPTGVPEEPLEPESESDVPPEPPESPELTSVNPLEKVSWFYPPSDAEGHADHFQFRGVPQLRTMMSDVLHSRRFPYRDESQIMRHALHSHLSWLQTHPGCPRAQGTILNSMMLIIEQEEYVQQFGEAMARAGRMIKVAQEAGNMEAAKELVEHLWDALNKMEPSPWKNSYIDSFRIRFQTLLTGKIIKRLNS